MPRPSSSTRSDPAARLLQQDPHPAAVASTSRRCRAVRQNLPELVRSAATGGSWAGDSTARATSTRNGRQRDDHLLTSSTRRSSESNAHLPRVETARQRMSLTMRASRSASLEITSSSPVRWDSSSRYVVALERQRGTVDCGKRRAEARARRWRRSRSSTARRPARPSCRGTHTRCHRELDCGHRQPAFLAVHVHRQRLRRWARGSALMPS